MDELGLATRFGDWAGTGQSLDSDWCRETLAVITEHGQQRWSEQVACPGQGAEDRTVWVLLEQCLQFAQGAGFGLHQFRQSRGQQWSLILVNLHRLRHGFWVAGLQAGEVRAQFLGVLVLVLPGKSHKLFERQSGGPPVASGRLE